MTLMFRRLHIWRARCSILRFDCYTYKNETGRIICFAFTILGHHVRFYPSRARF